MSRLDPFSQLPPDLLAAAGGLRPGQVTQQAIPAAKGFWVIGMQDRSPVAGQSYESAKPAIMELLVDQKRQALFSDWLETRLKDADIEVSDDYEGLGSGI